jgi:RNA polymerase sigma-70 factor (ECF subfamily)
MEDCQDIAQETVQAILTQLRSESFRSESTFETWAISIFRNKIADYWRHRARHARAVSVDVIGNSYELLIGPTQEIESIVTEALRQLSPRHRAALILNKVEGYTAREISGMTGVPMGTVNRLVSEAIVQLRDLTSSEEISSRKRPL